MAQSLSLQKEPISSTAAAETTSCENPEPSSVSNVSTMEITQTGADILKRLARQVEYYFSATNLSKDTYLSTLRSLNDGYVPISILVNFSKVRSLVPYDGWNAIRQAATEYSDLLDVVFINTDTGKRIPANVVVDSPMKVVEAVGPISGQPIAPSAIESGVPSPRSTINSTPSYVQNTVVLREVPQAIEEAELRNIFTFANCPAIQSLKKDVANCWFVTLDASSRDAMLEVMFELRKKKFESGESVLARLKTAAAVNRDISSAAGFFAPDMNQRIVQQIGSNRYGGRKSKRKKNNSTTKSKVNRNENSSGNKDNAQTKNIKGKNTNSNNGNRRNNTGGKQQQKKTKSQDQPKQDVKSTTEKKKTPSRHFPPPNFGEEQFPAIPTEDSFAQSSKTEVDKVPDQAAMGKNNNPAGSDASSTVTTSTSSSKSPQQLIVLTGYAAALRKVAMDKPQIEKSVGSLKVKTDIKKNDGETQTKKKPLSKQELVKEPTPVLIQPPSWGKSSFADILRSKDTSVSAVQ